MNRAYFTALAALSFACGEAPTRDGGLPSVPGAGTGAVATGGQGGGATTPSGGSVNPSAGSGNQTQLPPDDRPHGLELQCAQAQVGSPAMRLLTRHELEASINDIFPELKGLWSNSLPANSVSKFGFDNDVLNVAGNQFAAALLETAEAVGSAAAMNAASLLPCSGGDSAACAGQFVDTYGKRLFRRSVTAAERERYVQFFESTRTQSDLGTALKWMVAGLVQSPNAVYRREVGVVQAGTRQLTPHEVATQLAFTFTGKPPSAELLAQADSNSLGDSRALVTLAKEMLNTEDGRKTLQRFFEAYVGYPRASAIQRPNLQEFTAVSSQMVDETRAFVNDVLFQRRAGLKELLTVPAPAPQGTLAAYYGGGARLGVLGLGAFLSTHATSNGSSPTQRGNFVYLRLLCGVRFEVPPDIPQLSDPLPAKTTRQRYEELHVMGGAGCANCHARFDPIGFGFEHFDEGGRYRTMENGFPINAAATAIAPDDGRQLFSFTNQAELATALANEPSVQECFSAHLATYAFGTNEACLGPSSVPAALSGTMNIVDSFAELAAEPHFTQRKAE